jgi:uncharacterized protein (DUF305 family)
MNSKITLYLILAFVLGALTSALLFGGMRGLGFHGGSMMNLSTDSMMNQSMRGEPISNGATVPGPRGHGAMMEMMVSSEREFIELMIPHHEEAIATAREGLARGATTEAIAALYQNIIDSQTAEVALMREWYQTQYGEPYQATGTYQPMMRDLTKLTGAELDRVFLSDMIMHHMGAIMMARSLQPHLEHDVLAELTANIIRNQSAEIVSMREILLGL